MRLNRAVGYCTDRFCEQYEKGTFLLNHGEKFRCTLCRGFGKIQHECGSAENDKPIFKEVQLQFAFDCQQDRYIETAIVRDESLWGRHNVYRYCSPMIRTEKHALKSAESILAMLNQMPELPVGTELPNFYETPLNWDADLETFVAECKSWGESLRGSPLTRS